MALVWAFIIGAAVAAAGQIALVYLRVKPPMLIELGVITGAVMSLFGANDYLSNLSGGGYFVFITAIGGGLADAGKALATGAWQPLLMLLLLLGAVVAVSMFFGLLRPSAKAGAVSIAADQDS